MSGGLGFVIGLAILVVACNGGATEEEKVAGAVTNAYEYISAGSYEALWESYTSAFQVRCSFDDMVSSTESFRRTSGWDELIPTELKVDILDGQAVANYIVEIRVGGDLLDTYDYSGTYFKEDGEWRQQETCYPPAEG